MTPSARAAAAIEVLDLWLAGEVRAEKLLRDWGRRRRFAGSGDRRAISDLVYDAIRRRRSLAWERPPGDGRALIRGLIAASGAELAATFSGEGHAPPPLTEAEAAERPGPAPDPVAFDHPDWLEEALKASLGADYPAVMTGLTQRAPTDLRVNRLKATPEQALAALADAGVAAAAIPLDPDALRCAPGARVASAQAYLDGWVELQDAASQAAARLAAAAPGERVLDYCAGGGGKTLAFAAHMAGEGRLVAHDSEPGRLEETRRRADRAGAEVEIAAPGDLGDARFDLVFVDAPCSGSGAWRREPEEKWRLSPEKLAGHVALQRQIFTEAAAHLAPGGRIAFATCSILAAETEAQTAWIGEAHPALTPGAGLKLRTGPDSDGFFCQIFQRAE